MKRIGKDFQQFDSDTTAMVLLEGQRSWVMRRTASMTC